MNIRIHSVRFDADKKLQTFIENKLKKLNKFFGDIVSAEVFLRLEKTQDSKNKIAEIKLEIPGNDLFVKKQSKTFEQATDSAVNAIRRQLQKHKEKIRAL